MGTVEIAGPGRHGEGFEGAPLSQPFYVPQTVSRVLSQFRCASLASRASS